MFEKLKTRSGVMFIEVLMSLLILAVVLGGNAALFAKCNVFSAELKEQSIVNNALNERMEEIRNMSYSAISSLVSGSSFSTLGLSELNTTGSFTPVNFFSDYGNIRQVVLTVSWNSPQGRLVSKSLSAYFTKNGLYP